MVFCYSKGILKWFLSVFKIEDLIKVSNSCITVLEEFFILFQKKGSYCIYFMDIYNCCFSSTKLLIFIIGNQNNSNVLLGADRNECVFKFLSL